MKTLITLITLIISLFALQAAAQGVKDGRENYKPVTPANLITRTEITVVPECRTWPDPMANYTPIKYVFTIARLSVMSYTNTNDIIATLPGAYQRRRGDEVRMHGSGPGGFTYIVDGIVE